MHYLQIKDNRELSPLRKRCIQSVKDVMKDGDTYEMVSIGTCRTPEEAVNAANKVMFERAASDPELCYVDTDCFLHKPISTKDIPKNKPCFAKYVFTPSDEPIPDIYYFYVNGCTDYFKDNLTSKMVVDGKYSVDGSVLVELKNFHIIDDAGYIHFYDTMRNVVANNRFAQARDIISKYEKIIRKLSLHTELAVTDLQEFNESLKVK